MRGLLDLPNELLYTVIEHALTIPVNFHDDRIRYRPPLERGVYCLPGPDAKKTPRPMSLLLTNRRLYLETKLYLSRLDKSQTLELDIAIVSDHWIWPTARSLPVWKHNTILDKVEINLIPCCTPDDRYLQTGGYERDLCSTVASLVDLLYSFLENKQVDSYTKYAIRDYLAHPSPEQLVGKSGITRINTLIIRINTNWYGDGNRLLSGTEVPHRKIQGLAHLDFNRLYSVAPTKAQRYIGVMKDYIDQWLSSSNRDKASMRVGKILFCTDEAVWEEVSITNTTRRRLGEDFKKDRICYIDSDAAYEPNALALLLSSKALSAQTALYISKSPRLCEFDIAIVNAVYFFPTWRYIPTRNGLPSVMLEIVKVNLAPCCTEEVIAMVANWPTDVPPSGPKFSTPVGNASISSDLWEVQLFTDTANGASMPSQTRISNILFPHADFASMRTPIRKIMALWEKTLYQLARSQIETTLNATLSIELKLRRREK
ncbi:hypothetical protein A1F97_01679 [Pyrenophora tritici-repentis]|nr:hypothetical protein A1F96_02193 [Pyrenophora tritici-repentis]PZD45070.1 hypothetical protein A1F97_01679 [Pyrenophora tritici-repentis]